MTVHRLAPILLIALLAPVAHAQSSVDQLAELIRTASQSADPNIGFITGFTQLSDFRMNAEEIAQALAQADVPADGPLHALLGTTTSIAKRGDRVEIRRAQDEVFNLADAAVSFKKKIAFDVTRGSIESLDGNDARRMQDARGDFTHLDHIDGIKVSEGGGASFYNLYELYYVSEESGLVVAHVKAGMWIHKEWRRIPFDDDAPPVDEDADENAESDMIEVESSEPDPLAEAEGLPLPTHLRDPSSNASSTATTPSTTQAIVQTAKKTQAAGVVQTQGLLGGLEQQSLPSVR